MSDDHNPEPLMVVGSPVDHGIGDQVRYRCCQCGGDVWLSHASREAIAKYPGDSKTVCSECVLKDAASRATLIQNACKPEMLQTMMETLGLSEAEAKRLIAESIEEWSRPAGDLFKRQYG